MVEKEATAMIEVVRPSSHSSKGRRFTLVTDQEAVLFIFDQSNGGKIKNAKILNWKLVLSHMTYNIRHKPGSEKIAADASSPLFCPLSLLCKTSFSLWATLVMRDFNSL